MSAEDQINCVGQVDVVVLISFLIMILCSLPAFKGGPERERRLRNWRAIRFEMQDIALERFSIRWSQKCVVVVDVEDFVGPFEFGGQFLVFAEEVIDLH